MRKKIFILIGFLSLILSLSFSQSIQKKNDKKICITIDDLPAVTYQSNNADHARLQREITVKLINTFEEYTIPAMGFVVIGQLYDDNDVNPANLSLIERWLEHGYDLGNHTYSHIDYNTVADTIYFNNIIKGQNIVMALNQKYHKHFQYFRHPYLHAGADSVKAQALNNFLSQNHYIVSPVTIDNDDYLFAKAYAIANNTHDTLLMKVIGAEYVSYMEQKLLYFEKKSSELFSRNITQTLLLHASLLNAAYLDELAEMLIKNSYVFVSQDEVFNDPAYATPITVYTRYGYSWLFRWGLSKGMNRDFMANDIEVPQKILDIANQSL